MQDVLTYEAWLFPSPCGVWVVSNFQLVLDPVSGVSVPLRGVGCFDMNLKPEELIEGFRPLTGCGLFPKVNSIIFGTIRGFRPLTGCGLFLRDEL